MKKPSPLWVVLPLGTWAWVVEESKLSKAFSSVLQGPYFIPSEFLEFMPWLPSEMSCDP